MTSFLSLVAWTLLIQGVQMSLKVILGELVAWTIVIMLIVSRETSCEQEKTEKATFILLQRLIQNGRDPQRLQHKGTHIFPFALSIVRLWSSLIQGL